MTVLCVASIFVSACVNASTAPMPVTATVRTEPATPASIRQAGTLEDSTPAPPPARLPNLSTTNSALADAPVQKISLVAPQGSSIGDVAQQIGQSFGLNVSVDPDVHGTVAMNLHDVTLDEALREVVTKNGYSYQVQGRTLRISPMHMATRIFTLDYVALSRIGTANTVIQRRLSSGTSSPSVGTVPGLTTFSPGGGAAGFPGGDVITATEVSDLWTELRVALVGLLSRGNHPVSQGGTSAAGQPAGQQNTNFTGGAFATNWDDGTALTLSPSSGLITVTATDDQLADVDTYIRAFQASVLRQVLIEAKIVEVQLTKSRQFGIDWSLVSHSGKNLFTLSSDPTKTTSTGQTGNITFSLPGGSTQIDAVLTALEAQGNVNVLSNIRTSALNNQRAIFNVTTDEVFFSDARQPILGPTGAIVGFNDQVQAQTISVGIVLDVIPQISSDGVLTMNIRPVVSSLDRIETFTAGDGTSARFPVTSRREGDTMARVRNGETIIIGGLLQTQLEHDVSGIPVLKDLPLIGGLFRHTTDTENRVELVVFLTPTVIAGQPAPAPQ